jgi:tRNA threonylcarbamoyladenosine biosynthesis protein TsaE
MSSSSQYTFDAFPARVAVSSHPAMQALARALAAYLAPGDVVAISGPLGAGKTTLVRGIVEALTEKDQATSPTFTFRHTYWGPGTYAIEHLDLYRIDDPAELRELGLEEAFGPDVLTLIEWLERAPELAGEPSWQVRIEGSGDEPRSVWISRGPAGG